ncbi:Integrase [Tenacibaculum sp. 190130A14a]|uniref:Integrase n=1 Tax=Tenacibaculum polynesiense TaxID=3137857 RepID=A0ABP1F343_9FLAO
MSKLQNPKNLIPFIDYVPAELRENQTWEIVYYAIDPSEINVSKQLKRKRIRVKPMKNKTERRKYAKRIVQKLNEKLPKGWTPFINEKNVKSFAKLFDTLDIFLNKYNQQLKKGVVRKDTIRAYKSYINNFKQYLISINKEHLFINSFNEDLCRDFLDEIFYERENSAATHNNYLRFIGVFNRWLIKKRYLSVDFTIHIKKIKESEKKRTIIPKEVRDIIFKHIYDYDKGYYHLCKVAFYCLIRRTEMTKLKVNDVILKNGIINIPSYVSKNGKTQMVTIPGELMHSFAKHLKNAKNSDFLFSENFKPGPNQLDPKRISDTWARIRKKLKFSNTYQWYSLKDTGITNYLQLGIPTIDVKNQARHHSITQTEAYIPKTILKAVGNIQYASLNF